MLEPAILPNLHLEMTPRVGRPRMTMAAILVVLRLKISAGEGGYAVPGKVLLQRDLTDLTRHRRYWKGSLHRTMRMMVGPVMKEGKD